MDRGGSRYAATRETNATGLISAHYDSRGRLVSDPTARAPGANDDGSGTAGLLSIAHFMGTRGVTFHSNVEIVFFSGEEQGLLGSVHYAGMHRFCLPPIGHELMGNFQRSYVTRGRT